MVQGLRQATGGGAWNKLTRYGENKGSPNGRGAAPAREPKKKVSSQVVWREARELVARYRGQLAVGLFLMLVNRLAGLVLPASSKVLIDNVLPQGRGDLLWQLALAVLLATSVQAVTSFGLSATQLLLALAVAPAAIIGNSTFSCAVK